jgi:hypothetical protein
LGEHEKALAALEKAYAAHDRSLQYLGVDPAFDSLRSDPRFAGLPHSFRNFSELPKDFSPLSGISSAARRAAIGNC